MCEIAGISSYKPIADPELVTSMQETMFHLCSDDAGEWWSLYDCVGLGDWLLAILGRSYARRQPIHDASGELCIVFTCKINNFGDLHRKYIADYVG